MTEAQIQTKVTALNATYDALAGQMAESVSAPDRDVKLRQLSEVRQELEYWERRLAAIQTAGGKARPAVVTFGRPA